MFTKEKLERFHTLAESIISSANDDKLKNAGTIIQLLITQVDDLNEEVLWLKEENESMRFELQDKKIEQTPSTRRGRTRVTAAAPAPRHPNGHPWDPPF